MGTVCNRELINFEFAVSSIHRMVQHLGTSQDSRELRSQL